MPKSQSESWHTPITPLPTRTGREPVKGKTPPLQMIRELTPEDAKRILTALASDGDQEAKDVLERFLETYPNPGC